MNHSIDVERYKDYDLIMDDNGCLLAGIEAYPPYTTYDGKTFGGSCITIFNLIMGKLGLCYKLIKSPNGLWGREYPNGSWTGLVGLGQRKDVEVIVCPVATLWRRYLAIDYSEAIISTDYSIAYPRPVVTPNFVGFVLPFSYQTWSLLLFSLVFITGFSFIVNKTFFVRLNERIRRENPDGPTANFPNELWFQGIIAQAITKPPEEVGSRFLMAIWLLMMLVLGVTFRCNLKALLIVPRVEIPFNNLEELVNQDEYPWSYLAGSIIPMYFRPAYEEDHTSVMGRGWNEKGELYENAKQIREFVVERGMACIAITSKLHEVFSEDFSMSGQCRLATSKETLIKIEIAFGMRKKSKFALLLDPYIRSLREFGILQKIFDKDTANATYCNIPPGNEIGFEERPLTVVDFLGMFSILGTGYVLATIVFFLEIAKKKMEGNRDG